MPKALRTEVISWLVKLPPLSWTITCGVPCAKSLVDGLPFCKTLKKIELGDNQIGDCGATVLASHLAHVSSLEGVDLDSNRIQSLSVLTLANASGAAWGAVNYYSKQRTCTAASYISATSSELGRTCVH